MVTAGVFALVPGVHEMGRLGETPADGEQEAFHLGERPFIPSKIPAGSGRTWIKLA
jgi:hypothetical protein